MTRFQAHAAFCTRPDGGHSLLNPDCDKDIAPALCTAMASLSGVLDSCQTPEDLDEAFARANSLIHAGVFGEDELDAEISEVLDEVMRWGSQAEAELN